MVTVVLPAGSFDEVKLAGVSNSPVAAYQQANAVIRPVRHCRPRPANDESTNPFLSHVCDDEAELSPRQ